MTAVGPTAPTGHGSTKPTSKRHAAAWARTGGASWNRGPFMWHMARHRAEGPQLRHRARPAWIIIDPLLMAAVYYLLRTVVRPVGGADRNFVIDHIDLGCVLLPVHRDVACGRARSRSLGNKQMVLNTAFPAPIFPDRVGVDRRCSTSCRRSSCTSSSTRSWVSRSACASLILAADDRDAHDVQPRLSLLYAPLTVFFRDTSALLPYLTQIWTYVTPVLYSVQEIPPNLLPYLRLNPLFPFWAALEQIFGGQWPSPGYLLWAARLGRSSFLVGGSILFLVREREFAIRF